MTSDEYLVPPKPAPALNIPPSSNIVDVRVIDNTSRITGGFDLFCVPVIQEGSKFYGPSYTFLISHGPSKKHYLFDLAVRKDLDNLTPAIVKRVIKSGIFDIQVTKNVQDVLDEDTVLGVKSKDIAGIIWSHHHFDHIGDPSTFPPSTDLIVGPGFKAEYLPAYPTNPAGVINEADFLGRRFREVNIAAEGHGLTIGRHPAYDFFGDGSFYLLSTPGHTAGHICGLARVTSGPDTFILMGGDACHYGGEFRPTPYLPLPTQVTPSPVPSFGAACPGALVQKSHPQRSATAPFYSPKPGFSHDHDVACATIEGMEEFDAAPDVLVVMAHDQDLMEDIVFFPRTFNHWKSTGIKERTRWKWLGDLKETIEKMKKQSEL